MLPLAAGAATIMLATRLDATGRSLGQLYHLPRQIASPAALHLNDGFLPRDAICGEDQVIVMSSKGIALLSHVAEGYFNPLSGCNHPFQPKTLA
jgi:hypothetical protein